MGSKGRGLASLLTELAAVTLSALSLFGQGMTTASILGTITDSSGAVVPSASVSIRNVETGATRNVSSDAAGRYQVTELEVGGYEVQVKHPGFNTIQRSGIVLTVGESAKLDFMLAVGEVEQQVAVTAEAPLVTTTEATISALVDEKKIRDLPLNGRSFEQLAWLQPGVVRVTTGSNGANTGYGTELSVAGGRPEMNSFLLDGTYTNNGMGRTPGSAAGVMLGVESVREFSVLTNQYSAENGRGGGVLNAVTRSGSNQFHGSAFEFLRNSDLDARNFFDQGHIPPFKRNQFGGTAGGPVVRDRMFFFGSYEGLRSNKSLSEIDFVPTAAARQGNLVSGRVTVSPAVQPYLDLYPLPNSPGGSGDGGIFAASPAQIITENYASGRFDYHVSDADSFFARYTYDSAQNTNPRETFPRNSVADLTPSHNQFLTLEENRIFSPKWLNMFRFAYNRTNLSNQSNLTTDAGSALSYVPGLTAPFALIGGTSIGGFAGLGTSADPTLALRNLFEFTDRVSYVSGSQNIQMGFDIKRFQDKSINANHVEGTYSFLDLSSFLQAKPNLFDGSLPGNYGIAYTRQWMPAFYFQDDYRVTPKLTLNLGLRYEFITTPIEIRGKYTKLPTPTTPQPVLTPPLFTNPSLKDFEPRVGLAWDPRGNGKTSVRAGFGIFHEQLLVDNYKNALISSPPNNTVAALPANFNYNFPHDYQSILRGTVTPRFESIQYNAVPTYVMKYNLTVQKEIGGIVATASYIGTRGIHLARYVDANMAIPTLLPNGVWFFPAGSVRRNPNFQRIRYRKLDADSFYNALQASIQKSFRGGLQFQAAYTFSKSIDDLSHGFLGTSEFTNEPGTGTLFEDHKHDRGLSAFDIRNNLIANWTYDLPFGTGRRWASGATGVGGKLATGWQINGIFDVASGNPFWIKLGYNNSRSAVSGGEIVERPNLAPGANSNPIRPGNVNAYIDPSAFQIPTPGFFGNLGRNVTFGPGLVNFDFSLVKNTTITERTNLQFRAEFFNLFNRPDFAVPSGLTLTSSAAGHIQPDFGHITSTNTTSRQIQAGLKFIF